MKRRFLSTLMALVLALSLMPTAALAEEGMGGEAVPSILQQETETGEVDALPSARAGETVVVSTADALKSALENADADQVTVVLEDDIVLTQTITMNGGSFILDMDGYAITYGADLSAGTAGLVDLYGSANLTVTGDGEFTFDDSYIADDSKSIGYIFRLADNAQLVIENGTYYAGLTCVQVGGSSGAEIRDGTFSAWATYDDRYWILNKIDNSSTSIEVSGGTFENYDPSNSDTENPTDNFCADGYAAIQDGDNYIVVPIEEAAVAQIGNDYYLTLAEAISNAQDGDTIILVDDTVEDNLPYISTTVTLDLNGSTLTTNQLVTTGNLTIMDSTASAAPTVSSDYKTVSYRSGKISVTETAVYAAGGGTVTLESGCIDSSYLGAYAQGDTTGNTSINSTFNIEGGYIIAQEFAASAQGRGATLNISGGVLVARDNAVIGGNGTNTAERKLGGTTITISGGTMIGHILSNGYIACGIYHPQAGTLKITGGTIYVDGGVGIEMRGGTLDMTGGSVIATGHTSGKVGDSKVALDCYGIQIDGNSDYYDYANCKVSISGNACVAAAAGVPSVIVTPNGDEGKLKITGGYFTSDPSDFLAEGHYAVASDRTGYSYMVTNEVPLEAPVVVTENVETVVNESISENDKTAIKAVLDNASVSGVADALTDGARNDIVASVSIGEVTAKNIVEVEISVNVTATSAELSSENATVTYQVRPIATVKVDGETKSSNITVPNSYLNGQEFTVRLPLPAGLEEPREVMHIADNGSRERFTGDALTIGSGWVEVSISHFSELVVNAQETVAAKIGNAEYGTLQEAVNAAKSGDTIVLQADCNEPITISSKSVTIDRNGHGYNAALVTVGSRCEKTESGGRIIVAYTAPSTSSSSGSSSTTYSPTLDVSDGGTIKVSPRTPEAGDKVTITPDPDSGYEVGEVTVTDRSGDAVRVTANRDGTYTFTQPRGRVTIEVTFVRAGKSVFFDDVPASFWAYDEIAWAYDNGYVNGTSAATFSPNSSITRQQVWMILARLSGADPASMAAAREWAMVNNISDGTNPGNAVTRQQLVALLYRYAQMMGYDNGAREALTSFPDAGTVSGYAQEPMQWSVANGIVAGTSAGTLNPTGTATRAQFAVILYRFWDQVG